MPSPHGSFVWYELMSSDPAGAIAFYTKVNQWGTQQFEGPMDYNMWTNNGVPFAGLMPLTDELKAQNVPSHWLPYIGVRNVDDALKKAQSLGANAIVSPEDIPDTGRFAVLQDPQGAVFSIYTSSSPGDAAPFDPQVGEFSWHELMTTNWEAAFEFYSTLFEWERVTDFDMGDMGNYRIFGQQVRQYGGMFNIPTGMEMPPNWLCYVRVADINAAVDLIKANGGTAMQGPIEVPGGDLVAQCFDPQGAAFAVHQKP